MTTHILVAVITTPKQEATIGMAVSAIKLQNALAGRPDVTINLDFFDTKQHALSTFSGATDFDALCMVSSMCTFDPDFIFKAIDSSRAFIVGTYALPKYDFTKLSDPCKDDETELPQHRILDYNYTPPSDGTTPDMDGYLKLGHACSPMGLELVVIKRVVMDAMAPKADAGLFWSDAAIGGRIVEAHERFCDMWGGDIYADVDRQACVMAPCTFAGIVGHRRVLR